MQMAERGIGDVGVEQRAGQHFRAADDDAPLGVFRNLAAGHVAVAKRDQRLAGQPPRAGVRLDLPIERVDALDIGITVRFQARYVGQAQKRDRQAPGGDCAGTVAQRHKQSFEVDLAGRIAPDDADHARVELFQKRRRGFQSAG